VIKSPLLKSKGTKHKKPKVHNRRLERASEGKLLQIDRTPHLSLISLIIFL